MSNAIAVITSNCIIYLNFWQALTYRNATAKKADVNTNIRRSCIVISKSFW
jgi:hypothetical protein